MARADKGRKSGVVVAVAPADREALCFSRIAPGGSVRKEKIARIREQIRHGTYHIRAAEVAKAILRREPSHEGEPLCPYLSLAASRVRCKTYDLF